MPRTLAACLALVKRGESGKDAPDKRIKTIIAFDFFFVCCAKTRFFCTRKK